MGQVIQVYVHVTHTTQQSRSEAIGISNVSSTVPRKMVTYVTTLNALERTNL